MSTRICSLVCVCVCVCGGGGGGGGDFSHFTYCSPPCPPLPPLSFLSSSLPLIPSPPHYFCTCFCLLPPSLFLLLSSHYLCFLPPSLPPSSPHSPLLPLHFASSPHYPDVEKYIAAVYEKGVDSIEIKVGEVGPPDGTDTLYERSHYTLSDKEGNLIERGK